MKLTDDNYFSQEASMEYFGASQFKSFLKCEAEALAELRGEIERPASKALMIGSYVDAHFAGEMEQFTENHPEIFNSRTGELKADYRQADKLIARAEKDEMFMDYMSGDKQVIMTGEIHGHPFKIKVDSLHDDKIVDLKCMRDMKPIFKDGEKKTFIDAWQYDIQGYIYQQVVAQNVGIELPFYLAVVTKEEHPDLAIIEIPQWRLNSVDAIIDHYIDHFAAVKEGTEQPVRCERCGYCRDTKKLTKVTTYEELMEEN